jgi:hypothetical protein
MAVSERYIHIEVVFGKQGLHTYRLDGRHVRAWETVRRGEEFCCFGLAVIQQLVFVLDRKGLHAFDEDKGFQFSVEIGGEPNIQCANALLALDNEIAIVDERIRIFALDGTWLREASCVEILRGFSQPWEECFSCRARDGAILLANTTLLLRLSPNFTSAKLFRWSQRSWQTMQCDLVAFTGPE